MSISDYADKDPSDELKKALIALAWMYDQYCGDNFGHNFMGAGEDAIEILENYGLGDERKGINHEALTRLERGTDLLKLYPDIKLRSLRGAKEAP